MLLLVALFLVAACEPSTGSKQQSETKISYLILDGYYIPKLDNAEEQLAYGRASFEDFEEKLAALEAVTRLHPAARMYGGMAALEMAYLSLGADYRLAKHNQCYLAAEKYRNILNEYVDFPEIRAKALWYLGWISCDLLGKTQQAIAYFQQIVSLYPQEQLSILPPPPWLSIYLNGNDRGPLPIFPKPALKWSDIAHLEIIRLTPDSDLAWQSYMTLGTAHPGSAITGQALKLLSIHHGTSAKVESAIRKYLENDSSEKMLKKDLLLQLTAIRQQEEKHH